jgi:hypothetical protein
VTLGAATVLSRLAVGINSAHVLCGALVFATSVVLMLRSWRVKFGLTTPHHHSDVPAGAVRHAGGLAASHGAGR